MKVGELIEQLRKAPQDAEIFVNYDGEYCQRAEFPDPALVQVRDGKGALVEAAMIVLTDDHPAGEEPPWVLPVQEDA